MGEDLFKLQSVLLCDDIRQEDNGKAILIGVYSGDIVIQGSSATLALSLWIQGRSLERATSFSIELRFSGEKDVRSESSIPAGTLNIEPNNDFLIAIGKIPIRLTGNGSLSVGLKFGDYDWTEIIKKKVITFGASVDIEKKQQPS